MDLIRMEKHGHFKSFRQAKSDDEMLNHTRDDNFRKPFYWEADEKNEIYANKHDYEALRLNVNEKPTLAELIDTCRHERVTERVLFEQGMWVEYRSNDMKWKIGLVNRVVKQAPDDWDFDFLGNEVPEEKLRISYNVGVEGVVSEYDIRAPTAGLKAIFGQRPWLWLQFTLLQLEKRVRFDSDHEYDYDQMDFLEFATSRFEIWLQAEENADFKEAYDRQSNVTQTLLRNNLFSTFELMNEVVDKWSFLDKNISVYTYTATLGSGLFTLLLVCLVQLLIPPILVYNNMLTTDGAPSKRFLVDDVTFEPLNGRVFPATDFETLCDSDPLEFRLEGKLLLAMVIIIYLLDVVPESVQSFYRTSGGYYTTYSKITSLVTIVWENSDDRISQEIGFKVDRMLNTGCLCTIYIVMLFILLNTPIVVDLILNALAVEFIHHIDERIAQSEGYDDNKRWIRAGTVEVILQGQLSARILRSAAEICHEFDIEEEKYREVVGGMLPLYDSALARLDDEDPSFMTRKEYIFSMVAKEAKENNDKFVLGEYRKKTIPYGFFDYIGYALGNSSSIFRRYQSYRVWSRWEKVLFLPRVVDKIEPDENLEIVLGKTDLEEFRHHIWRVLTFYELFGSVVKAIEVGHIHRLPLKLSFGVIEWTLYIINLMFPVVVIGALFFLPFCY